MKIPKLLILGIVTGVVCVSMPAIASDIQLSKTVTPATPNIYHVGDTIHFVLTVTNPSTNPETNTLDLIEDIEPDGTHTTIATNVVQVPGASNTYYYDYVVVEADLVLIAGNWRVVNTLHVTGVDTADDIINATTQKTSRVTRPSTIVGISAKPDVVCTTGTDVTLTVTEENDGITGADLTTPSVVVSDGGGPIVTLTAPPDSGDDGDGILEVGETWSWDHVVSGVSANTTFTAVGHGLDPMGYDVTWCEDVGNPPSNTFCDQDERATVDVTAIDPPVCNITGPTSVCEGDSGVQYCSENTADSYSWKITGDGEIPGATDGQCVSVNPTGPGGYTLSLELCNGGCCSECNLEVDVIPTPDCTILGETSLCDTDIDTSITYCSDATAGHYKWVVKSGPATIDGADNESCVKIIPSALGDIVLELQLWDDFGDQETCGNSCQITITVEECGKTFCTFTQGFWGNAGGKGCDGKTTTELINQALGSGPVVVGILGQRSITFDTAQCIIDRLPAGGTPSALPVGLGDKNCSSLPGSLVKKNKPEINNVLVGQVVALTLNLRVSDNCLGEDSEDLALWELPEEFCTVPFGDEEACAEYSSIPTALASKTVQQLLDAANAALAGDTTFSISDIYNAVTAINEGFDECRTIVPCVRPEICDNGCDDDLDGLIDGDDPDCQAGPVGSL